MGRLGRHGAVYASGILLARLASFIMLPIYTRYLTPADYGVLQLITMVLEVVSIVAGSRLSSGIFYLFHKAEGEVARRSVVSSAFAVIALSYCMVGAATYIGAPLISRLVTGGEASAGLLRLAAASLAFESLVLVPLTYLQVRERSVLYVSATTLKLLVQLGLNIALVVWAGWAARGVLTSALVGNIVVGALLSAYLLRDVGTAVVRRDAVALLEFGLPLAGTQVATFIATFGDRYFLNRAADTAAVGIYGLAYQFGFLFYGLAAAPFNNIWEPARFAAAKREDKDEVFARAFLYYNVLLVTVAVLIVLFVSDFIHIMAAPAFWPAVTIVPVIVVAYLLQAWTMFHNVGLLWTGRTDLVMWANWIGAAVAVAGYVVLIPPLRGMGAALATVASFAFREWLIFVWSQRLWRVSYSWAPVLRLLGVGTVVCLVGLRVSACGQLASIATHGVLTAAYGAGLWFARVFSEEDRRTIRDSLRTPRVLLARLTGGRQP